MAGNTQEIGTHFRRRSNSLLPLGKAPPPPLLRYLASLVVDCDIKRQTQSIRASSKRKKDLKNNLQASFERELCRK